MNYGIRCNLVESIHHPGLIDKGEVFLPLVPRIGEHVLHAAGTYLVEGVAYPAIPAHLIEEAAKGPQRPVLIQVKKV